MAEAVAAVVVEDLWMPAAAAAVESGELALISTAAASAAGTSAFGTIVSNFLSPASLARTAAGFVFNQITQSLFTSSPRSQGVTAAAATGALINAVSNVEPIPTIYGTRRVGGSRILTEVTGSSNEFLHLVVVWSEGEIAAVNQVYLDGVAVSDARFSGLVSVESYTGTDTQTASAALIAAIGNSAKWNANCTLSGLAYSYVRLTWSQTAFPTGLPNVTADIDGIKLYDPRDAGTRFSHNPALAIRDYLTNERYGRGFPSSMLDDDVFGDSADHCEERVTAPTHTATFTADASTDELIFAGPETFGRGDGVTVASTSSLPTGLSAATTYYIIPTVDGRVKLATSYANALARTAIDLTGAGAGTMTMTHVDLPRYTCDGLVSPDDLPLDTLRALMTSCRGYLVYSGGEYKLRCDRETTAGSFELDESNILGAWSFAMGSKRTRFNRVKATFFDPSRQWQPNLAVQESSAFRAIDNDLVLETQADLPFTANVYRAGQIAQVEMKQSRFGIMVSLTATIAATELEVGDVVPVTHTTPGWDGKEFRVVEIELLNTDEVRLTLREYDDSVYTLDAVAAIRQAPRTNLPDPSTVGTPGTPSIAEALYQTTGSAGVKSKATITWAASADKFVIAGGRYQVEYQVSGASSWKIAAHVQASSSTTESVDVFDLAAGSYNFRVRAFNSLGAASSYSATTAKDLFGLTAAPSNLTNFLVQNYNGLAKFTWSKPSANSDLDVIIGGRIYVRWSPKTSGASWDYGILINPDGFPGDTSIGFGPLMAGTYMAKAADSSGNYSGTEATFLLTEALITGLTTIATVTESPGFTGTKSNVTKIDGGIQLDSATTIDGMLTLMDSWGSIDALGGLSATGSYSFASKLDLTSAQSSRLFSNIDSLAFDADDLIDSRTNNIDDWGLFDGAAIEDAEVQLMVRTTPDDPNGVSPTWSAWQALGHVADYYARGFDFRLDFATGSATHNRTVTTLSVSAKH